MTQTQTRSQDEIVARMKAIAEDDWFGFRREVLTYSLDYEHAKPMLKEGTTEQDWHPDLTEDEIRESAAKYLEFAWGKARDHRGLSANRSVDKLGEFAWLLGNDELAARMRSEPYAQYGAPALADFARAYDLPIPEGEDLANMIEGRPCHPGCEEGCG